MVLAPLRNIIRTEDLTVVEEIHVRYEVHLVMSATVSRVCVAAGHGAMRTGHPLGVYALRGAPKIRVQLLE